jgi:mono/diheme cytochrome c family protein
MTKKLFVVTALLALMLAACSESKSDTAGVVETVPAEFAGQANPYGVEMADEGAELYGIYCSSCHGKTGLGDGVAGASLQPAPSNLAKLQAVVEDDYLFWRIRAGKSGTAMVGWKGILSDEQIWQVVAFIRTLE